MVHHFAKTHHFDTGFRRKKERNIKEMKKHIHAGYCVELQSVK